MQKLLRPNCIIKYRNNLPKNPLKTCKRRLKFKGAKLIDFYRFWATLELCKQWGVKLKIWILPCILLRCIFCNFSYFIRRKKKKKSPNEHENFEPNNKIMQPKSHHTKYYIELKKLQWKLELMACKWVGKMQKKKKLQQGFSWIWCWFKLVWKKKCERNYL